ncbi:MAG: helicase-associated domain-containing protein [Planctomycetes bacterium]|nr:helicase-associated domain-containing protein [Planctomycetota bacterium]
MSGYTLRSLLRGVPDRDLRSIEERWIGRGAAGESRARALVRLAAAMEDEELVQRRFKELSEKLSDLVETFLGAVDRARPLRAIFTAPDSPFRSRYEVEASLVALAREGFVLPVTPGDDGAAPDGAADEMLHAMPLELAQCIDGLRHRQRAELRGTLTLQGFLQERYYKDDARQRDPKDRGGTHARRVYKIYVMESSIRNRIAALPRPIRAVFDRVLATYGGLLPATELPRIAAEEEVDVDVDFLRKSLEEAMLGTVAPLKLARFGLEPIEPAVVVFFEVALFCLQDWSESHGGVQIDEALSSGVDLLTNLGRFLRDVATTRVQFTVDGNLYKASARRIVKNFLAIPGGYMPPETQARFIYGYCLGRRLIERSGERALRLSSDALDFEHRSLHEKLRALVAFVVEERGPQGEHYHQVRLRRVLLRLLRRLEPEEWYEALFVPFLARNAYLGKLDELRVEDFFAARFKGGGYVPSETAHQLCLQLLDFVRRRLYPLGLVDLGLREGRPVAIRLSRLGAELLGAEAAGEVGGHRSTVVVNPDFEVILFPGDDEHEAVHTLDQFCERLKTDHIHHFHISRHSVQAALTEGVSLHHIVQELTDRSRTPLPQNVLYSLEDWADQAGVLLLDEDHVLHGRRPEVLDRFAAHPRFAEWVVARRDADRLALRPETDFAELRDVARDLGFLIERQEGPVA